jgi:predicted dehydrogenase
MTIKRPQTVSKTHRRQFLQRAAALAAGGFLLPELVPASALGLGTTAPSERVNLALIGCGQRGSGEAGGAARSSTCQFVAVCDPWDSRTEKARQMFQKLAADHRGKATFQGCDCYRDFREVLARPDIDGVYIATGDYWHVPITIAAARAGKDMHTEKPFGLSIEQDLTARQVVRQYGRVFQYGTEHRSTASARHAIELVLNGRIGQIQAIYVVSPGGAQGGSATPVLPVPKELDYELWQGPAPEAPYCHDRCMNNGGIFFVYDYSIGFLGGWAAHPLDMVQWWADHAGMGIPVNYEGTGSVPEKGFYNTVNRWDMQCRYPSGLTMYFVDGKTVADKTAAGAAKFPGIQGPNAATFVGTEGWISVGYSEIRAQPAAVLDSVIAPEEIHLPNGDYAGGAYVEAHHASWHNCMRSRRDPVSNIESAVRSDLMSHLTDICVRLGRPICWDPVKETIVGDEVACKMMSRPMRAPWQL